MRRTKIVATIGPASGNAKTIEQMLQAGMDVARLNFSHGTHEYHAKNIALLREAARKMDRPLTIIQDLQGPKIRTGRLVNHQPVHIKNGDPFAITIHEMDGTAERVSTTYKALPNDVQPGDRILVSDGLIELRVRETTHDTVHTEVVVGGELRENQGINLPCVNVSTPSLTPKDIEDLAFGLSQNVDYIALSFVRHASDIADIKERIAAAGKDIPVIAKIEKPEALEELAHILKLADAIMVARGDLGVEIDTEQVPIVQKKLIDSANDAGVPVITATQMLDSMIRNPRPTRAEASDVANAIIDGTDAVMLSGETATGSYPVEAVQMMAKIAEVTESSQLYTQHVMDMNIAPQRDIPNAISEAARAIVEALSVKAIVAFTMSGNTARLMSRQRPRVPILVFTPSEVLYRRLNLIWGITPFVVPPTTDNLSKLRTHIRKVLVHLGLLGDDEVQVVVVGGHPLARLHETNFLRITRFNPNDDDL